MFKALQKACMQSQKWCHDIQHTGIQHTGIQHTDIQHDDIRHNDTENNGTQHNGIQHSNKENATLSLMIASVKAKHCYAECHLCLVSHICPLH